MQKTNCCNNFITSKTSFRKKIRRRLTVEWDAIFRMFLQQQPDEINCLVREIIRDGVLGGDDSIQCSPHTFCIERRLADEHRVEHAADRPDVCRQAMGATSCNLATIIDMIPDSNNPN